MPERKEYRVVGREGERIFVCGGPYDDKYVAGWTVDDLRRNSGDALSVHIQTRTVRATPWVDLPESKQGERG